MMNLETFQPRASFILVRREEIGKQESGIVLPTNEYGNFAFATIVAVGPGNATVSNDGENGYDFAVADLKRGMLVLIKTGNDGSPLQGVPRKDNTLPFKVKGEKLELLHEGAVIAIVTRSEVPA